MNTLLPVTRMIDAALQSGLESADHNPTWSVTPHADVLEGDREYRIRMDLPGIDTDAVELNVEHQTLTVKAERSLELPEGFQNRRQERAGKIGYSRTFRLGNGVDVDGIRASLKNGVLEISLPKSEQSLPRRIEVQ